MKLEKFEKKEVFIFNPMDGRVIQYGSCTQAGKAYPEGFNHSTIVRAIKANRLIYGQYLAKLTRPTQKEQLEAYIKYWDKKLDSEDIGAELWEQYNEALEISNMGRVKACGKFLIPRMAYNRRNVSVKYKGVYYNVARMVAEKFLICRPLQDKEKVIRKGPITDIRSCMLYVADQKEIATKLWGRENCMKAPKEVFLYDEEGQVVDSYRSVREAAEANYLGMSGLYKAIREGRKCCGMDFRYADYKEEEI